MAPGTFGAQSADVPSSGSATETTTGSPHVEAAKDEVGWYFVEQYYTNLSRSPEKLHLFYTRRSQFVCGVEAEKAPVAVGRTAIAESIKQLDYHDCKVRVSNVDSQASFSNIVIQVIGEISNKSAPHRKFVQTFVLAEQPNGYFVLNDMLRFISDDIDVNVEHDVVDAPAEKSPLVAHDDQLEPAPTTEDKSTVGPDPTLSRQPDIEQVDTELNQLVAKKKQDATEQHDDAEPKAVTNGVPAGSTDGEPQEGKEWSSSSAAVQDETKTPSADAGEKSVETAEQLPDERPKEPQPTPAVASPKVATATAAAAPTQEPTISSPAVPSTAKFNAPKTWAHLVAASNTPLPASPSAAGPLTSPNAAPSKTGTPTQATGPSAAMGSSPTSDGNDAAASPSQPRSNAGSGWQTAGGNEHVKRQNRLPSMSSGPGERDKVMAYVKNVTDKVSIEDLRIELTKYGELVYFDVSRPKNCAFVEFTTPAGYNAAIAVNPHVIGGEQVWVEERRPRSNAYGGSGYYSNRGGGGGGGPGPNRGGRIGNGGGGNGVDGRPSYQGRGGGYPREGGSCYPREGGSGYPREGGSGYPREGGGGRGTYGPGRGRAIGGTSGGGGIPFRGHGYKPSNA